MENNKKMGKRAGDSGKMGGCFLNPNLLKRFL